MEEIWKDIEGYEGLYQVSNLGNIMSLGNGNSNASMRKLLKPFKTGFYRKYLSVKLLNNGIKKTYKVHRIVAEAFLPNPDNLPQVNHKDENTENNRVENLEWCDAKYNSNYGTRTRRQSLNMINNPKCSKPILQYSISGLLIQKWPSMSEVQRQLGYDNSAICSCCKGKRKSAYGFIWRYASDVS